jgi:hypothetical protein
VIEQPAINAFGAQKHGDYALGLVYTLALGVYGRCARVDRPPRLQELPGGAECTAGQLLYKDMAAKRIQTTQPEAALSGYAFTSLFRPIAQ